MDLHIFIPRTRLVLHQVSKGCKLTFLEPQTRTSHYGLQHQCILQTPNNVSQFEDFILETVLTLWRKIHGNPPIVISQKSGVITVPANQNKPVVTIRSSHLFNIVPLSSSAHRDSSIHSSVTSQQQHSPTILQPYSTHVQVDPNNILSPQWKRSFIDLHMKYDDIFDPKNPGYNGAAGPFKANVNMGFVMPPQRKGRIPMYSRPTTIQIWWARETWRSVHPWSSWHLRSIPESILSPLQA